MMSPECTREQDVLDALSAGRWPARCERELQEHVAGCSLCRDLAEAVGALAEAQDETWQLIQVPSGSTIWWRAQLRARREAAHRASTPITVAQAAAGTIVLVALVSILYVATPSLSPLASLVPALPGFALPDVRLPSLSELGAWRWVALGAFLTWVVLAPLALYLAGED